MRNWQSSTWASSTTHQLKYLVGRWGFVGRWNEMNGSALPLLEQAYAWSTSDTTKISGLEASPWSQSPKVALPKIRRPGPRGWELLGPLAMGRCHDPQGLRTLG